VAGEFVVRIDHARALRPQRCEHCAVLASDLRDAFHELLVFTLGVVDERDRRRSDGSKRGGFSRMIDPQLDDRCAVVPAQSQQRLHRASACSASSASEKGSRRPAISWYFSWPFPAMSTTSSALAEAIARAIAVLRSFTASCATEMAAVISAMMAAGSSPRG